MFYLSKRLRSIVNKLAGTPKPVSGPLRSRLSFLMDMEEGYRIVEPLGGLVPRALGKDSTGYRYIVGNGCVRLSGVEVLHAEEAKHAVVDAFAGSGEAEMSVGALDKARKIAAGSLLQSTAKERADFISYLVAHDTVGYGPISMLMEDRKRIEEIEINAPSSRINVFHVDYGRCSTNLRFANEDAFRHNINKLIYETDKELRDDTPIIDAQVGDARVHAQIRPYALSGAAASIRLADNRLVGPNYLIKKGTTDFDTLAYLWLAVDSGLNIIIAGAPASGKTTMMSALFGLLPRTEKILTIEEEVNELKIKLDINNSVALYGDGRGGRTNTREQVMNALRMRPDRLVVGEVRGAETRELFSGASLGIPFMTTMHSNSGGLDIVKKLIITPMDVEVRSLSSLDIALYMKHIDVSRRVLGEVYEYRWLSRAETEKLGTVIEGSDSVDVNCAVSNGRLDRGAITGSKVVEAFSKKNGLSKALVVKELDRRSEFLRVACEGCASSVEVLEKIQGYA